MDDVFYYIIIIFSVVIYFADAFNKGKKKNATRNKPMASPPAMPQRNSRPADSSNDEQEIEIESLEDLIKALRGNKSAQPFPVKDEAMSRTAKSRQSMMAASTPPKISAQAPAMPNPAQQSAAYMIEAPEAEGVSAITASQIALEAIADDKPSNNIAHDLRSTTDWRRAIIAHEILKRKF